MSEGFLGKIGGSDSSKMILFMFLGLVIAILVLGFHRSPAAAPAQFAGSLAGKQQAAPQLAYQVSAVDDFTNSRIP